MARIVAGWGSRSGSLDVAVVADVSANALPTVLASAPARFDGGGDRVLRIERCSYEGCDWEAMDAFADRFATQSGAWLQFLADTQGAEPVVAKVVDERTVVGYFTGLVTRRYGLRILGSPLPGWSTAYQGFNLVPGVRRADALDALIPFAFRELGVHHVELRDRLLVESDVRDPRCHVARYTTFDVDLSGSEDDIFGAFTSACRRAIRRGEKVGLTVEEASPEGFASEYYAQLVDVFARQGLRPTYDQARVAALIRHVHPSGHLLLLRASDPDGNPIATGIFPALGSTMFFWGGASLRSGQQHRPNEAIFWYALRYWKGRGATTFDLGGGGDYKRKYGGREVTMPHVVRPRLPALWHLREWMRRRHDPDNPSGRFRLGCVGRLPGSSRVLL